jgi:hypothetical protein
MESSDAVVEGLTSFYDAFCSHDPDRFASALSTGPGVSVLGSAPGEGHDNRDDWIASYAGGIVEAGLQLEGGPSPQGWADGTAGFARDEPRFVLPDGSFLPTRLTGVLRREDDAWKIVHLHFSVGVPDEEAVQPPP